MQEQLDDMKDGVHGESKDCVREYESKHGGKTKKTKKKRKKQHNKATNNKVLQTYNLEEKGSTERARWVGR